MFWNNFYNLCLKKDTTPSAVVKSLGISAGTVTAWKRGVIPATDKLNKLSHYFNVPIDDLLGIKKETSSDERFNEFMDLYNKLSEEDKALAEAMLKKLAGK